MVAARGLEPPRAVRLWATLAFIVPLALYVASLSPYVAAWDTAEFQTVPYIFGIAHPTGFPLFIMLGWTFTHILPVGSVAWRMGLLSALCMSASCAVCAVFARRIGASGAASLGAALLLAVGEVAWTRGTRAEVHTLATLEAVVAATAALAWYQDRRPHWLVVTAIAVGLGLATHPTVALTLPGLCVLIIAARTVPRVRIVAVCIAAVFAPLVTYAYIPLRSAWVSAHRIDPTLALGLPPGRPFWDYGHPSSLHAFTRYISGSDFSASASVVALLAPHTYVEIAPRAWSALAAEFPPASLVFAIVGAAVLLRRDPLAGIGVGLALLPCVPFAYAYAAEADAERYALPAFFLISALMASGVSAILALLAPEDARARATAGFLAMAIVAGAEFWSERDTFAQRDNRQFADYVQRVRLSTPEDAVLVADWSYATPLAYAAYVERNLGRRIVETAHPGDDAAWLARWSKQRPVYVVSPNEVFITGVRLSLRSPGSPALYAVTPAPASSAQNATRR